MLSEDKKLKGDSKDEKIEIKEKEKDNNDKNTEIPENIEVKEKKEITLPLINIRKVSNLSDSIINYFVIAISLFLYSSYNLEWFSLKEPEGKKFIMGYFIISGITLYVIGVLNWYEGKELLFLFDFTFSFLFVALFLSGLSETEKSFGDISSDFGLENPKLQGLFYIILFCFMIIIGISAKDKGLLFPINYGVLFVGFVFLFADKFFDIKWLKLVHAYAFIIAAAIMWVTGILKLINNGMVNKSIKVLEPTD
jgi:hypothetical protein